MGCGCGKTAAQRRAEREARLAAREDARSEATVSAAPKVWNGTRPAAKAEPAR